MDENFLLQTETAQKLYHEHAAKMPIIDYHCHLIPQMVAEDYQFKSLTEIWLGGDHYKWRAMRTNGVDERFCTGKDTTDWEKFEKWAETVPYTFRNPLYHWTHLELKTAFGIDKILNPHTAREIYDECNEKLKQPEYSARGMMRRYHVEVVCTTDDPIDSLEYHIKTRESGFEIKMLPTWRPDKAMAVEVPADFRAYVEKLAEVSDVAISSFDDMVAALRKRHDFFAKQGCKLSDHGIEEFYAEDYTGAEVKAIFNKVYGGTGLTKEEILKFKSAMLVVFGEMDWEKGWTQQFHYGAIRNNNSKMFKLLGPDTGFDSIGEFTTAKAMAKFLDRLNSNGKLTKTILYNFVLVLPLILVIIFSFLYFVFVALYFLGCLLLKFNLILKFKDWIDFLCAHKPACPLCNQTDTCNKGNCNMCHSNANPLIFDKKEVNQNNFENISDTSIIQPLTITDPCPKEGYQIVCTISCNSVKESNT